MTGDTAQPPHPAAVILGLDSSALELCRCLGRRGVPVVGLDTRYSVAAASRYCRARICADPRREPDRALRDLLALAQELGSPPVLAPPSDDWVVFMADHRAALEACCRFAQPSPERLVELTDKAASYGLARRHGLEVTRYAVVENASDLGRAAAEVGYPCVLKPARSGDWRQAEARAALRAEKMLLARDEAGLQAAWERASRFAGRHVVQELLPGRDSDHYYVVCYLGAGGAPRAHFVHRKLAMRPPGRGVGCLIESVRHDDLAAQAMGFLTAIGYRGLAGMEFKHDRRDGRLKLLDLNPRWGQGDSLAAICGVDMGWLYYCDSLGLEVEAPERYRVGVKWVQLRPHLAAAWAGHRQRGDSIWRHLWNLRGELHHSILAWDDLGPARWLARDLVQARLRPSSRPRGIQGPPSRGRRRP